MKTIGFFLSRALILLNLTTKVTPLLQHFVTGESKSMFYTRVAEQSSVQEWASIFLNKLTYVHMCVMLSICRIF